MTPPPTLPETGYALQRVYANSLQLAVRSPQEDAPSESPIKFDWDWRFSDSDTFDVSVRIRIDPSSTRHEAVDVSIVGRFVVCGNSPTVALLDFVRQNATSILLPYAREAVTGLTARGFFGPIFLPPTDVTRLIETQDPTNAHAVEQLRTDSNILRDWAPRLAPEVAAAFQALHAPGALASPAGDQQVSQTAAKRAHKRAAAAPGASSAGASPRPSRTRTKRKRDPETS